MMSSFNEKNILEISEMMSSATANVEKVFKSGRSVGNKEGYLNGRSDGYFDGLVDGRSEGREQGYSEGYSAGREDGYQDGYKNGKQAEYNAFWDAYLPEKLNWQYVFYSDRWSDSNFYPNKDLIPTGNLTFGFSSNRITDLKQRLIDCNVKLDTSKVSGGNYMFCFCLQLTHLPSISLVGLTSQITNTFENDIKLVEIEKIILKNDGSTTFKKWFDGCSSLRDISFEGVIGENIDFSDCTKLTQASIESIVNHLSDTGIGKTLILSEEAVDNAFAVYAEDGSLLSVGSTTLGWRELSEPKESVGWTIELV